MRANIYIRKANEDAWEKIEEKSDWVNRQLATPMPQPHTTGTSNKNLKVRYTKPEKSAWGYGREKYYEDTSKNNSA
jgi:hypothetical protein